MLKFNSLPNTVQLRFILPLQKTCMEVGFLLKLKIVLTEIFLTNKIQVQYLRNSKVFQLKLWLSSGIRLYLKQSYQKKNLFALVEQLAALLVR